MFNPAFALAEAKAVIVMAVTVVAPEAKAALAS